MADQNWPYLQLPRAEEPAAVPQWHCPAALCVCHPSAESELIPHSITLYDHDINAIPGARCRIWHGSSLINAAQPNADSGGTITVELAAGIKRLVIEWAPADTPIARHLPYRRGYRLDTGVSERERIATRLDNAGYYLWPELDDNVREFQRDYGRAESGQYRHVAPEIVTYHDSTGLPPPAVAPSPVAPTPVTPAHSGPPAAAAPSDAPQRPGHGCVRERAVTTPFEIGVTAGAEDPWTESDRLVIVDNAGNMALDRRLGEAEDRNGLRVVSFADYQRNRLYTAKVLFKSYEYVIYENVPIYDLLSPHSPCRTAGRPARPFRDQAPEGGQS